MKRLLWTAAGAVVGWFVWTKVQEEREERSIWAEVTDSFGETPDSSHPDRPGLIEGAVVQR